MYHEQVHVLVIAGFDLVRGLFHFGGILMTPRFKFHTPREPGGLQEQWSTMHVRTCASKSTEGDCLGVLDLYAQGWEIYREEEMG